MANTKLHVKSKRSITDREQIYQIIDRQPIGHIGFIEEGLPYVIPVNICRINDNLYWHGSVNNRIYKAAKQSGRCVTITFTLVHGLVASTLPSKYDTSYSSAMVFGTALAVLDLEEKREILSRLIHRHAPQDPLQAKDIELHHESPAVCKLQIEEYSGKQSLQDEASLTENQWLLPIQKHYAKPVASHANKEQTVPSYIQDITKQQLY